MGTVTGLTADRMLEIEAASVVDGDVSGNDLILTRKDGSIINAGNVRGPQGPAGPMGSALQVVTARQLLEVGQPNQIRAGRQLTPADFTSMGLSAPLGLWNLSGNSNDSSGNSRHLTNKGAVPFAVGINGIAATAAQFAGSSAQALYWADTGVNDPFRVKSITVGTWFRNIKRSGTQYFFTRSGAAGGSFGWYLGVDANGHIIWQTYHTDGTTPLNGVTTPVDVSDDKWHFIVGTLDGTRIRVYVDGRLEASTNQWPSGSLYTGAAPINLGGYAADASLSTLGPTYTRMDEAFILGDVLNEKQVRNLFCASIPHALGATPARVSIAQRRRRRAAVYTAADFPAQPRRLYRFLNGSLSDEGANNTSLTVVGSLLLSAGSDGAKDGAYRIPGTTGNYLAASDAGLPAGTAARSYGGWFKSLNSSSIGTILAWGNQTSPANADIRMQVINGMLRDLCGNDNVTSTNFVADGLWHFAVAVAENSPADGLKHRLYLDGELVGSSTTMGSNPTTLLGANGFRIGMETTSVNALNGETDGIFVCDYVLSRDNILDLFNKGVQELPPSARSVDDHIETIESARLLAAFEKIDASDLIDLAVAA